MHMTETSTPADFNACVLDETGEDMTTVDLRDLDDATLAALRAEGEESGDHGMIDTIDWIVRSRIAQEGR